MTDLEEFLEHQDRLVVSEVATSHYQLINSTTEEVWETFLCPASEQADRIQKAIGDIPGQLPTGKHVLRLQAVGTNAAIRGQIAFSVDGRSGHAKAVLNDVQAMQKAVRMSVDTAEQQLSGAAVRQQQLEERAQRAEQRLSENAQSIFEMHGLVAQLMNNNERHEMEMAERRARIETLKEFAGMLAPLVPTVIQFGNAFAEYKVRQWRADARAGQPKQANGQQPPQPTESEGEEPSAETH